MIASGLQKRNMQACDPSCEGKRKRFDNGSAYDEAIAVLDKAYADMESANNGLDEGGDRVAALKAIHKAQDDIGQGVEHAARVAALITNKAIIKAAKLANVSIISDIKRYQCTDLEERIKLGRHTDALKKKAKAAANKAVVFATKNMPDRTMYIAGRDVMLNYNAMPVYLIQHRDDSFSPECYELDRHNERNRIFW
jgi:hypothetical protein